VVFPECGLPHEAEEDHWAVGKGLISFLLSQGPSVFLIYLEAKRSSQILTNLFTKVFESFIANLFIAAYVPMVGTDYAIIRRWLIISLLNQQLRPTLDASDGSNSNIHFGHVQYSLLLGHMTKGWTR